MKKGTDVAVTAADAGEARIELLRSRMKDVLTLYSESGDDAVPKIVCVFDADTDVLAHDIVRDTFGVAAGVHIFVTTPNQFLQPRVRETLAEHIGKGIERARAGSLNVVVMAHQGALAVTIGINSATGELTVLPIDPDAEVGTS